MTNTRHNPESLAPLAQEKEMDFEKYKANAAGDLPSVVVNHEGTWQTLKLAAEPTFVRGKVVAEVEIAATATAPARTETLVLDYAPQVVEFERGDGIENQTIIDTYVRKDGRVEYNLHDGTEETIRVPQELLVTWRKTLELEDQVTLLGTQIATVAHTSTEALTKKQLDASKLITTIKAELGAPSDMQDLGKRALTKKLTDLETAYTAAETAVKELRTDIAAVAPDARGLKNYTHFEHLTDAERAERKTIIERIKTEVENRTKDIKEEADEQQEELLEKKIATVTAVIEAEAQTEITAEEKVIADQYGDFVRDVRDAQRQWAPGGWDDAKKKDFWKRCSAKRKDLLQFVDNLTEPKTPPPYVSLFDDMLEARIAAKSRVLKNLKIEDSEKAVFDKMRKGAEVQAYYDVIAQLRARASSDPGYKQFIEELDARRLAEAASALTGDIIDVQFIDMIAGVATPRVDATTGNPVTYKDYNDTKAEKSARHKKNMELFKAISTEWTKAEKTPVPVGSEAFDFDVEGANINTRLTAILDSIPKQADGTPVPAYRRIFDYVNDPALGIKYNLEEAKRNFANLASADAYVTAHVARAAGATLIPEITNFATAKTRENLTALRRMSIDDANIEIIEVERDITELKNQEAFSKAQSEYNKHEADEIKRKQTEIKDYEGDSLNLSAEHLKPLLEYHHAEVANIMGKLYRQADFEYSNSGELKVGKTTLSNDIIEDFKKLFDATSIKFPADPAVEALMHRIWPEAGVKDFEKFKTLWKEKLAGEVAKSFKVLAEETLAKKTAEKMQGFRAGLSRAGKMKGALALRIAMTVGFVGVGIATGGLAAGALGIAGAAGAAVGGATGGAMRGWLNKKVFGKMFEKTEKNANKELLLEKKDEIIEELIRENYSVVTHPKTGATTNNWLDNQEGLEQFSTVLAQTIREFNEQAQNALGPVKGESEAAETARKQKIDDIIKNGKLDELVAAFSVNEKHVYLDTLAAMAEQHPSEKQKFDLARAIFIMRDRGSNMHTRALNEGNIDPIVVSTLDRMVSSYSGKRGIGAAALSGGIIAGVFASHEYLDNIFTGVEGSTLARGTLGGIMGAVQGYRFMEGVRQQQEREEAKAELFSRMSRVRGAVIGIHSGTASTLPLANSIRGDMIGLKRLLHGTATPYETGAVVTIQKGGGKPAAYADKMLIKQIQGLVFEAEDLGLWVEKVEERRNLGAALDMMKKNSEEIEKNAKDRTRDSVWYKFKKNVLWRGGGIIGGAAIGAASSILIGKYVVPQVREGAHWVGEKLHIVDPMPHDTLDLGEERFDVPESRGANYTVIPDHANPDYVDPHIGHDPDVVPGPAISPEDAKALHDLEGMEWGPKETFHKGVLHFDDTLLNSNKQVHDLILERERAMYEASSDPRIQGHANWSDEDIIKAWKVRIGEIDGKILDWGKGLHAGMYKEGVTYHPYIRPDGTVGITGDQAHWEKGLFKFGAPPPEAPPLVPEPEATPIPAHQVVNVKNFYEDIYEHNAPGQEIHVGADVTASMEHVGGIPIDAVATENISSNPDLHTYLARVKTGGEYKSFIYVSDAEGNFYRTPLDKFTDSIPSVHKVASHSLGGEAPTTQTHEENSLDRQAAFEDQRHLSFEKNVSLLANDVNIKHNMFTRGVLQLRGAEGKQALHTFINDYVSSHPDTDFTDPDSHDEFLNAWRLEARKMLFPLQSEMTPEPSSAPVAPTEAPAAPVANAAEVVSSATVASPKHLAVLGELDGKGRHLSIWDNTFDKPRDVALPEKWHPTVGDEGKITIPGADGEEMKGTIEWKNVRGRIEPVFNVGPGEKYLLKDLIQDMNKANPLPEPGDIAVRDAA